MANVKARFPKSPSLDVASYEFAWKKNGVDAATVGVNRSPTLDANGYEATWTQHNPLIPLNDADAVVCEVRAVDGGGKKSDPLVLSLTIPDEPPLPPPSGTLTLA